MAPQTSQNTKKKVWLIAAIIIVLITVTFLMWKTSSSKNSDTDDKQKNAQTNTQKAALTVTVVSPEQQNWKQVFTANGNIAAWQEVVISSELSGQRLTRVNVNVGDEVKRGQILAEINS